MPPPERNRDAGLDALRAALTLLVVFHHAALTYGAIGGWFYREVPAGIRPDTAPLVLFVTVNQAFFMGLFFLIAGSFTPQSVTRHGAVRYARDRLLRLGLPLLAFGLVIGPATIALAQTAQGTPISVTLLWLWRHRIFETGPLWFVLALLLFGLAYLAWPWPMRPRPFPSNRALAIGVLATGGGAFASRLVWPVGTTVLGLQPGYFASYIVLFAAGCAGAPGRWLTSVPQRQKRLWLTIAWLALPVFPATVLLAPHVPALAGNTEGGWSIPAAVYAVWEPLVAWGFILGLLTLFQRRFPTLGPIWINLSRRAYAIYIVHSPVLVAVALAWRGIAAPHLVKFLVTGTITCLLCNWISGALLRVPWLRRVL